MAAVDVLVASVKKERVEQLAAALADEGFRVEKTASAARAAAVLGGEEPCRLVVLGRELDGQSPFDVLFEAVKRRDGKPGPKILLAQNIRSDFELLALLERRGVTAYLDERDDLAAHVRTAVGILYAERRARQRIPYKCAAMLLWPDGDAHGKTADLTRAGAGLILDAKTARKLPPRGSSVMLIIQAAAFGSIPTMVDTEFGGGAALSVRELPTLPCKIRSVSIKSRLFGDIAMVGLEFDNLSEHLTSLIDGELERVAPKGG